MQTKDTPYPQDQGTKRTPGLLQAREPKRMDSTVLLSPSSINKTSIGMVYPTKGGTKPNTGAKVIRQQRVKPENQNHLLQARNTDSPSLLYQKETSHGHHTAHPTPKSILMQRERKKSSSMPLLGFFFSSFLDTNPQPLPLPLFSRPKAITGGVLSHLLRSKLKHKKKRISWFRERGGRREEKG